MTANTSPIFSIQGLISSNGTTGMAPTLTTAAADYTGVSANNLLVFTATANGSFLQRIRFKAIGTNITTVARIYINNGSDPTTATNNSFYGEVSLPATTISASAPTVDIDYSFNIAIPPGYKIYVGLGTTVAAGWAITSIAGSY